LFPDICAKTENGFVATGNCFFVPHATKQWPRKSNDFNQTCWEPAAAMVAPDSCALPR
jgi:hypothetical protein